jgi:hypothetical protein
LAVPPTLEQGLPKPDDFSAIQKAQSETLDEDLASLNLLPGMRYGVQAKPNAMPGIQNAISGEGKRDVRHPKRDAW